MRSVPFTKTNDVTPTNEANRPGHAVMLGTKGNGRTMERPETRRSEILRPASAPAGDRPTPIEMWLQGLGLDAHEVERCPAPECEICTGAMPEAA